MIGNLALGFYIIFTLLIPLKIKGSFIVQFYIIALLMTLLRIIEISFDVYDPNSQDWEYGYTDWSFYRVVAIMATLTCFVLGIQIISTMYQITLSIRVMVGDVDYLEGRKRRNYFYGFLVSLILGFVIVIVLACTERDFAIFKIKSTMFITFIVIFALLSAIFTVTICKLMQTMKKVSNEACFESEKSSILQQFFFFLVAFVTRTIFYSYELYLVLNDSPTTEESGEGFWTALVESILYIVWNVLPVSFVFFTHLRTFKAIKENKAKMQE